MIVTAKSDIGKMRSENQDRYRVCELSDDTAVAVVCDGMGGAQSGGLASEIASNAVYDRLCLSFRSEMEPKSVKNLLVSAVSAANAIIFDKSHEEPENEGMGTTCVAALIHSGSIFVASVGDSRAYILDPSGIRQITTDHTVVQYLKSHGMKLADDEESQMMRNVITRAVGVEERVEVDYFEFEAERGSILLICTDGLTNYISDELIYEMTYKTAPETAVQELVNYANQSGGKDNITVALVSI